MLRRPLTRRTVLRTGLAVVALVLLAVGLLRPASKAPRAAPPLPSRTLSGRPITLAALRGHAAVVLFWAPWCIPCQHEAPAVERFARSPAGHGHIVAVDDASGDGWRAFVRKYHWSFPVFADPDLTVGVAYEAEFLPTTVFISAAGRIASMSSGAQTVASLTRGISAAA
jgi:cytochrome c biogenesis protein CcmG, thiol:disulfide interchange protein DsbE